MNHTQVIEPRCITNRSLVSFYSAIAGRGRCQKTLPTFAYLSISWCLFEVWHTPQTENQSIIFDSCGTNFTRRRSGGRGSRSREPNLSNDCAKMAAFFSLTAHVVASLFLSFSLHSFGYVIDDSVGLGRRFDGIGGLSAGVSGDRL